MILFTKISSEDTEDLIVFNDYFRDRKDELRKILISLKPQYVVEEILFDGIFLSEDVIWEFSSDGKILKQCKDGTDSYRPYCKGDRVVICTDGNLKKCAKPKGLIHKLKELMEDIYIVCSELNDTIDNDIEKDFI